VATAATRCNPETRDDPVSDTTVWLSQEAYDRLHHELEELKTSGRAEASTAIEAAREHGDVSENAEYEVAKEEQGKLEARIRELEHTLAHAKISQGSTVGDAVAHGNVVTITDSDGERLKVLLSSREDRTDEAMVISPQSPLGTALLGTSVGEKVTYQAPAGQLEVTVEAIDVPQG
jgi:transcription elongation factor GreA